MINVSEGRDPARISAIAEAAGSSLVDLHSDPYHHRSVYTLAGRPDEVEEKALSLSLRAVELLDLRSHQGVHPRLGVVDVVPFVPLGSPPPGEERFARASEARARFAGAMAEAGVPCFLYGSERSLPEVRRRAFVDLLPDVGPSEPHPTAGACCVGVRDFLVAYNLVIKGPPELAREIARRIRRPELRALGFDLGGESQVSCNLLSPETLGPGELFDEVSELAPVVRTELVGLVPRSVLERVAPKRWGALDLSVGKTIERALEAKKGS